MAADPDTQKWWALCKPCQEPLPTCGAGEFRSLRPFGHALTESLTNARVAADGRAVWEEEDYCSPPLAEERAAVLDTYFRELEVQRVAAGEGWRRIVDLPRLFPPDGEASDGTPAT